MDIKPQDILFVISIVILLYKKDYRLFIASGIFSLVISMPLFAKWIFFTAERLTWYSMVFFSVAIVLLITSNLRKESKSND